MDARDIAVIRGVANNHLRGGDGGVLAEHPDVQRALRRIGREYRSTTPMSMIAQVCRQVLAGAGGDREWRK